MLGLYRKNTAKKRVRFVLRRQTAAEPSPAGRQISKTRFREKGKKPARGIISRRRTGFSQDGAKKSRFSVKGVLSARGKD